MSEIEFEKYKTRGAYHWEQISRDIKKRNSFVVGRYINIVSLIKKHYIDLKGKTILDVGCGDGVLSYLLCKDGALVSGIDNSDIAIQYAKERTSGLGIDFQCVSAYDLPWEDEYFDVVVSSDVIEHVEDVNRFLCNINRVVKSGGTIVISTPIRFTETPIDKMHVVEWFPEEFKQLIMEYFPKSTFYKTHPLFWMEMMQYSFRLRKFVNLLSLLWNPFECLNSNFRYMALQFSLSVKEKN